MATKKQPINSTVEAPVVVHRIQDLIDRRFYRRKCDAQQAWETFAASARDAVNMDRLAATMLRVVQETIQPEQVSWRPASHDLEKTP